ncbi:hypothetical protein tinsulaeT_23170 [Thalassotalea insulae]|uniref:Serine aminopeptidase S33 domain-containing protein n=1 Tax=Thalassotalea insulae TaxID=2056778 RepID=A0ABQ6GWH6_9GAMM|nr:alpha/beta hydrolase [Thalassotalea insulae]GLX78977.1 hypothetical protein tinsulaeT_23170 [Thalassotalea insulae]
MHRVKIFCTLIVLCFGCQKNKTYDEWFVTSQQNNLAIQLFATKQHSKSNPIAIFVHGDGPSNNDSHGYYLPIINHLNAQGISAVSWHKPGVENSTGNWLSQSMNDRAIEVEDVINDLRQKGYRGSIGIIGFSQAGWVLPYINNTSIDFAALISPAINWQQQSAYQMMLRLIDKGVITENDLDAQAEILNLTDKEYQLFSQGFAAYQADDLHQHPYMPAPITDEARFNFISMNMHEDATAGLAQLNIPLLVLMGAQDTQVDSQNTLKVIQELPYADDKNKLHYRMFAQANHQLLHAEEFNGLSGIDWYLKFQLLQADAFAPDVLPSLTTWIKNITK